MEDKVIAAFTIFSLIALIIVYIINGISTRRQSRLFRYSASDISKRYETEVTPADYTYNIWSLIFLWQAVWTLYAVGSIWRTTADKDPILMNPDILPLEFHLFWIVSCILNITWLFLWDREYIVFAFADLSLLTLCGYSAIGIQAVATAVNKDTLAAKSRLDLTLVYVLVQNGTAMIYSWTSVATLMNLSAALSYNSVLAKNISKKLASTISLSILGAIVLIWSVLENTILYEYLHFVYTWYGVVLWTTVGILVKNYVTNDRNTVITILVLCLSVVCCVIKIVVYAKRSQTPMSL